MQTKAEKIVGFMYDRDWFSQWLGIERVEIGEGHCILTMITRKEMLNGFGILHGGISFSLADSALAFASNSHGRKSVSIEGSMTYTGQVGEGELLRATAKEVSLTNKIAVYDIQVTRQDGTGVALFKGIVYRTGKNWLEENS